MSISDKGVSNISSYYGDNADGKKQHSCCWIGKDMGKAKQVVMRHFIKAKMKLHNNGNRRSPASSLSANTNRSSGKSKTIRGGCGTRCYFCFARPQVMESFDGSPTSTCHPNDLNLRNFLEKNDFYSKEFNPHVD